jgi:hypothetical protein
MKKVSITIMLTALLAVSFLVLAPHSLAASCDPTSGLQGGVNCAGQANGFAQGSLSVNVNNVINVLLMAVGIISVIMIIIGGIRYALSGGDEGAVKSAKDTILYAVVGLVVAILAFAIVNFVLKIFFH